MARGVVAKSSSSYTAQPANHAAHFFEKPAFQYLLVFSVIATFVISVFALVNTYQLKKAIIPKTKNASCRKKICEPSSETDVLYIKASPRTDKIRQAAKSGQSKYFDLEKKFIGKN